MNIKKKYDIEPHPYGPTTPLTALSNMSKEGRPPSEPTSAPEWNETMIWPLKPPKLTAATPTPKAANSPGGDAASAAAAALGWDEAAVLRYYRQGELSVRVLDHDR